MVGRTAFGGDLVYSIGVSGFIYPIIGHWVWGPDGWLATMNTPFRDFAGSTVVHTIGGVIALAGAIALGPRIGRKFKRDGGGMPPGHDMILASLGGVILWFGWYGFNPGSARCRRWTSRASAGSPPTRPSRRAPVVWWRCSTSTPRSRQVGPGHHHQRVPGRARGDHVSVLLGVAARIALSSVRSPRSSWCCAVDFVEWLRVDDPIGAVAVHGACGIFGTLSLGLFATGQYGLPGPLGADTSIRVEGLFYGGGFKQLGVQALGQSWL